MMKKIIKTTLTAFIFLVSSFAFSQNISVDYFINLSKDDSAETSKVVDINDELCALIKISTNERNFEFSNCNIERSEEDDIEIRLFVSPNSKSITIKHQKFGSIDYTFPENIQSGKTYMLKLKTKNNKKSKEQSINEQYLIIKSSTPDAEIFIDNEYAGKNNAIKYLSISEEHSYEVEAPLYHSKKGKIILDKKEKTELQIDLEPAFGYLDIKTSPSLAAKIEINGKLQEQSSPFVSEKLSSGTYNVQAFTPMYKSNPIEVVVEDGITTEVIIDLIPNHGTAEIVCQDIDADIYIDSEYKAKGMYSAQLGEGKHLLEVKKAGHISFIKEINIVKNQISSENVALLQPIYGVLKVNSEPINANIYINGKFYGTTPNQIAEVLVGEQVLELKKSGYNEVKGVVNINENEISEYSFTLQKKEEIIPIAVDNAGDVKLIKTLFGHHSFVESAVFSPNGLQVASASRDNSVKIWDVNTGECVKTLTGHNDIVNSAVYSPNGNLIVSGSKDNSVKIWDANTGKCIKTLVGHNHEIKEVCFNPKGNRIASASMGNIIKIWDVNTGLCLKTLNGHNGSVLSVAYSPNGKLLASGSWDHTIKIWDANSGECIKTLEGHFNVVFPVCFSPDGKYLASGSVDRTIKIWNVESGECIKTLTGHYDIVTGVCYSPDGSCLVSSSIDRNIKFWNIETGECLKTLKGHNYDVKSVNFSPDGSRVVSGSMDNNIKIWGGGE